MNLANFLSVYSNLYERWIFFLYIFRIGEKVSYKSVPRIVDVYVKRCCEGYRQSGDDLCYRMFILHFIAFFLDMNIRHSFEHYQPYISILSLKRPI